MKHTPKVLVLLALFLVAWPGGLLSSAATAATGARPAASQTLAPPVVVLVRHAETAASTETTRDPELSELGRARAGALAQLLGGARVTHLYASEYQRTQATLAPLAAAAELEPQVVAAGEAERLVATLRGLPAGSVAVVAGHSNTVPGLVAALGGQAEDLVEHEKYGRMLRSTEYDRLFVVSLPGQDGDPAATLELRYGEPSER